MSRVTTVSGSPKQQRGVVRLRCMGSQTSAPLLVPQAHFPHALSPRYSKPRVVVLRLEPCFWSHTQPEALEIRDVTTNLTMFRVPATAKHRPSSKRLLDMYNAPVATLDVDTYSSISATSTITPAASHSHLQHTCTVETKLLNGDGYLLVRASWADGATITCEGEWTSRHPIDFWLSTTTDSTHTRGTRIARVRRDPISGHKGFLLEIAPFVDVPLVLLVLAAAEEAASRFASAASAQTKKFATATRRSSLTDVASPNLVRSGAVPIPA